MWRPWHEEVRQGHRELRTSPRSNIDDHYSLYTDIIYFYPAQYPLRIQYNVYENKLIHHKIAFTGESV